MKCANPACGKEFEPTTKNGYTTKFCSRSCANSGRETSKKGKKSRSKKMQERWQNEAPEKKEERLRKSAEALRRIYLEELASLPFEKLSKRQRREKILTEQAGCCALCGIAEEWNGMPLNFQMDHIDGDRTNESRENLRLLCPNCHSQTDTYGSKNMHRATDEELLEALESTTSRYQACLNVGINPSVRVYERIDKLIKLG
jgi:5-methylcytosine-specific restriction endonuclease McrA